MTPRTKLLVVDDQTLNIQVIYEAFAADYQLFMATNGAQAVAMCISQQPDLVLLDVEMPDMDGFDVCARIKSHPATRDIPVIFVTAHNDEAAEARGLDVGAVDFVSKPINPKILRARVKTHTTLKLQSDLLRSWAYMDGLTGVHNRRYFDEHLTAEWDRAQRSKNPLSLILLDVDFFKRYNDHYGHQAGDECLLRVATAVRESLKRPADKVARYGGEEFVCLLPDTDLAGASQVAQAIGQLVAGLQIAHADSAAAPFVTVSLGVCGKPVGHISQGSALELVRQADTQLYAAKAAGRNRTHSAELTLLSK